MATALATEPLTRPSVGSAFDDSMDSLAPSMKSLAGSSSLDSRPRNSPPPNPPFIFPAQPAPSTSPPSFTRAAGRRPMSAIETPNFSFGLSTNNAERQPRSALPDFSFNPGSILPPDPPASLLTPPMSPLSVRNLAPSQRPVGHGHRRGGSEFVGGRLREGSSIAVMSTSPTKSESGFATPTSQPPRRGHRRGISGAISTNDLPILLPPAFDCSLGRGSSAPTSPTNFLPSDEAVAPTQHTQLVPAQAEQPDETLQSAPNEIIPEGSPKYGKPGPKARVGFSDTLEFIPRPLSPVSNDTSSTVTTRPDHSVSGSISSIVSTVSPSSQDNSMPLSRSSTREPSESRPSTAGAILERTRVVADVASSPKRRNSIPILFHSVEAPKVEAPEPSPTKASKRWSFFLREPSPANSSPTKARLPASSLSDSLPTMTVTSEHGSGTAGEGPEIGTNPKCSKKGKKKKRKKRKVKGWAGAILPRKPKGGSIKRFKPEGDGSPNSLIRDMSHHDKDDYEMYGEPEFLEVSTPTLTVTESPNSHDGNSSKSEEELPSIIDLDAALGPFNTPIPLNPEWEAAQRAAGNTSKRRLHSAQGMKGFSGPGMHYHRRAESAPDLPPFDPGRAGMHRYNSSSTMADVFEEEEEDEDRNGKLRTKNEPSEDESDSSSDATTPPAAVNTDPLLDVQGGLSNHNSAQSMGPSNSSINDADQFSSGSVQVEQSKSSPHDNVIVEEFSRMILRSSLVTPERNEKMILALPSLKLSDSTEGASVDMNSSHLPAPPNFPNSPYAMSQSSSFPSPRSPMSVEVQCISTASSSVADENNFESLLMMGEPGPEVRISVDYDIPSLTSSNSITTRESMFLPSHRMSQPTLREPRPSSCSSAAFGRRRSSLVSLSRLINSSHGERSKLSVEVTLDKEAADKKSKSSRTKRLSRLMQFWKSSKETTSK